MIDTSQARARILERIRRAQKRPLQVSQAEQDEINEYLRAHPRGPQQHAVADIAGRFMEQARRMSSSVDELAALDQVPTAVARYLDGQKVAREVVINPALAALDWAGAGVGARARVIEDADLTAVTGAFAAIAETGTLVFLSSPETPASNNLLPENHIVVLRQDQIVFAMEDAFDRIRAEPGGLPRALNLVSGPSRTGDIEQTIVLGAHGPYRVHILLVAA